MAQKAGQIATNHRFADASAFLRTFSFIPRPEHNYDRWLKPDAEHPPIDLLRPYDADKMTAWKVDKAVGQREER